MENLSLWKIGGKSFLYITVALTIILAIAKYVFKVETGDLFSLGQLLVELMLIPTVIAGFYFTAIEFRASQQTPDLHLYWELQDKQLKNTSILKMPPGNGRGRTPRLIVKNEGKSITTWYLIRLDFPTKVFSDNEPKLIREVGNRRDHPTIDSHWHTDVSAEKISWQFMSNGEYALYPNYSQPICVIDFEFSSNKEYPENYAIPFVIYCDRGKEVSGELFLSLQRQEKQ